jgi:hypothetical protein
MADVTQGDPVVKVTLVAAVSDQDDNIDSGARTPTFRIQVLILDTTVQCHMNFNTDGPCGTQQTTGCPAVQC